MTIESSMSFDPAHARLRKRAAKQLKQTTAEQLEQETKKMEERIRALKEQMVKEKEDREKIGGTRWSSGKTINPQSAANKKSERKTDKGPRKIKILTDEPLSTYTSKKTALRESINETFTGPVCGQCEKAKATLACNECTESYCVSCFMSFHRKGALRAHTTRNLDQFNQGFHEEKQTSRAPKPEERSRVKLSHGSTSQNSSLEQKTGGALLNGTFDEDESSASFAQALKEWRSAQGKDNTWVNPEDSQPAKVKVATCETSTVPEKLTPIDMKLNFSSNSSLSYLDRLVLKKHREEGRTASSPKSEVNTKKNSPVSEELQNETDQGYGINYREIFQSLGAQTTRDKASLNGYERFTSPSKGAFIIEEVPDNIPAEEALCIVDEGRNEEAAPQRPTSRTGCVSIMGMTASGDFRPDADDLHAGPPQPQVSTGSKSSLGGSKPSGKYLPSRSQSASAVPRVWSPKPGYKGLSNFFLVGVDAESASENPRSEPRYKPSPPKNPRTPSPPKRISPKLLAQGVWKPDESVYASEEISPMADNDRGKYPGGGPVIPLVQEPADAQDAANNNSPRNRKLKIKKRLSDGDSRLKDFGINDFLKASPVPSKFSEDYYDVHRVSTVSPLSLSPKPPQLHWSDDDSDDDVILEVTSRASMLEVAKAEEDGLRQDQEDDDKATLEDLTWELASTTGRLTHCEGDLDEMLEPGDSSEVDSIEEDPDTGSTCSLNDSQHELSIHSSDSMDEEEIMIESRMMEREVKALE
ncbi:uncharacterized protein LOC5512374 isoform X2 [Nematostella vectensis]|uniref:uncharacterized protein LOC5512374 isoform X2 n=1 Tax=Nematostella vectensis TaxID=45351 RepID=UPI0020775168|nr:uncharacterized protein LOC5512374 isoform X2 [Nematostella vectensis]